MKNLEGSGDVTMWISGYLAKTAPLIAEIAAAAKHYRDSAYDTGLTYDRTVVERFCRQMFILEKRLAVDGRIAHFLAQQAASVEVVEDLKRLINDVQLAATLLQNHLSTARSIPTLCGAAQVHQGFVVRSYRLRAQLDLHIARTADLMETGAVSVFARPEFLPSPSTAQNIFETAESCIPSLEEPFELVEGLPELEPSHDSDVDALKDFLHDQAIDVFGFGEIHPPELTDPDYDSITPTTLSRYARSVVPWLVQEKGVEVLGLEFLPEDIESELQLYFADKKLNQQTTPALVYWHGILGESLLHFLNAFDDLRRVSPKLSLHGLEPPVRLRESVGQDAGKMFDWMNQNSARIVAAARAQGRKVALYTGAGHCKTDPLYPLDQQCSYVASLGAVRFAEVRLLTPEHNRGYHPFNPGDWVLTQRAPRFGVTMVARRPNACVLVYARR